MKHDTRQDAKSPAIGAIGTLGVEPFFGRNYFEPVTKDL
jgi:hypothetical protein